MKCRIATSISLGIAVWLAGCVAQTEMERPMPGAARTADGHAAPLRSQVDAARGRVWSLSQDGVSLHDFTKGRKIAVALPGWHWAGPPFGCQPDLALGPRGEVIVTSDVLPTLWRVDPETLVVTVHSLALDADKDRDVGFSSISYSVKHGTYFAFSPAHGSLWKIDPLLRRALKAPHAGAIAQACGFAPGSPA